MATHRIKQDVGALRKAAKAEGGGRVIWLDWPEWAYDPATVPAGVSWHRGVCYAKDAASGAVVAISQSIPKQDRAATEREVKRLLPLAITEMAENRERSRQARDAALDAEARALGLHPDAFRAKARATHAAALAARSADLKRSSAAEVVPNHAADERPQGD